MKGKAGRQAVIFRVYIEDRSEPGGNFPGGANAPADVYCFQAWALPGPGALDNAAAINARNTVANDSCAFLAGYTQGATPNSTVLGTPLIEDCIRAYRQPADPSVHLGDMPAVMAG